jgi:hypothetical protein
MEDPFRNKCGDIEILFSLREYPMAFLSRGTMSLRLKLVRDLDMMSDVKSWKGLIKYLCGRIDGSEIGSETTIVSSRYVLRRLQGFPPFSWR